MTQRTTYRAVIFDMDGVLVDSEPAFYDAVNDVLAEEGRSIDWERYKHLLGTSVQHTWREVIAMLNMLRDLCQPLFVRCRLFLYSYEHSLIYEFVIFC